MTTDEIDGTEEGLGLTVYLALLALTAATLAASFLGREGRLMAVAVALIIASAKAGLIGFYYMDLRRERVLMYAILLIGASAVGILLFGILPDVAFFPR